MRTNRFFVFLTIWSGQCVSLLGSGLTSFALGVWVYQQTGSATQFALIALFTLLPRLVFSPLAGALVDRWDRRKAMMIGDTGAGICTLVIAVLLYSGTLEVWHIYLTSGLSSIFGAIQFPAYSAAITLLVPKQNLGRANGMVQLGRALSEILAPVLAGILVVGIGLQGVILVDFTTYLFAVLALLTVRMPLSAGVPAQKADLKSLWKESAFGLAYLRSNRGLMGLLVFLTVVNFVWSSFSVLVMPMLLGFTTPEVLGMLITIAGGGMLAGSLLMSAWGGPRRRILGIIVFELVSGAGFILMGLRPSAVLVAIGAFAAHFTIAIIFGTNQALWQSKVPAELQGRIFAAQEMVTRSAAPLAYLIAGPLADRIFEPLLLPGGAMASGLGLVFGVGPGRGIALLVVVLGGIKVLVSLIGLLYTPVREAESSLPDVLVSPA